MNRDITGSAYCSRMDVASEQGQKRRKEGQKKLLKQQKRHGLSWPPVTIYLNEQGHQMTDVLNRDTKTRQERPDGSMLSQAFDGLEHSLFDWNADGFAAQFERVNQAFLL